MAEFNDFGLKNNHNGSFELPYPNNGIVKSIGIAGYFRYICHDLQIKYDGTIGNYGCDCNINNIYIWAGSPLQISSFVVKVLTFCGGIKCQ